MAIGTGGGTHAHAKRTALPIAPTDPTGQLLPYAQLSVHGSQVHSLAVTGRAGSHEQSAKANQSPAKKRSGLASSAGAAMQANCSGWGQSLGAAIGMVVSQKQPTPSFMKQRPSMGLSPDLHALHRKVPGLTQSQMLVMPASPTCTAEPSSLGFTDASAVFRGAWFSGSDPHPAEAPTTTIVWNSRDALVATTKHYHARGWGQGAAALTAFRVGDP
jgi:hypothetical protein